jgi:hypothetical protein
MPIFECSRCNALTYSSSTDAAGACARCGSERHRILEGGFAEARQSPRSLGQGDHATLVYDDPERIVPFCARFLTEGIDAGEHVVCGVHDDLRRAVSALLAPDVAVLVDWQDPGEIYAEFDADRVAAMYDALIGAEPRTTRILAGLDGACAENIPPDEFDRYEAAAHAIITGHGATALCLYDARSLPEAFLPVAARRHTLRVEDDGVRRNEQFAYEPA